MISHNFIFGILTVALVAMISCKNKSLLPYQNDKLTIDERVKDLVSRMTLDEKISQMMHAAPAIPRLGIPAYNWWSEGLHGVAWANVATVFPQSIGMGATFNDSLLFNEATVISDEFRAKYNEFQRLKDYGRCRGLTVWSPNINIFRDPRWGRGQETYGEDPWLTSRMGVAFIKGMQGDNPLYLKTIATPKHYAVHSGPENLRHKFNANVSESDFSDTYLPAFEACIKEGGAYSIMGAYNRFRGKSCSASDTLLTDILRYQWGFKGYVVSDCGAISDIYTSHKIVTTSEEAAALAVKAGCDLECGETYSHLGSAVKKGLITEKEIDVAVKRLFVARFKLGMFDNADKVPYNKIPISVVDQPKHRQLSIEAARQSIVLLRNENNVLPLKKGIKTIAVIGPNADVPEVMYGNYNGTPSKYTTILEGIKKQAGSSTRVIYTRGCNLVERDGFTKRVSGCFEDGLKAEFFNNDSLGGTPVLIRKDNYIDFSWAANPYQGVNSENFSVRWSGVLIAPASGKFEFSMTGDDGYRLFIDDKQILSDWTGHAPTNRQAALVLEKGKKYKFRAEFFNGAYGSMVSLYWKQEGFESFKEALEYAKKADVVVFVGGISPALEGEEMSVNIEGFKGGDRTSIDLPKVQTDLLKELKALGKPIVLVLLNGSALAINWESKNIPAIVEAWYPGQEGGTAVADVLFGNYNPAGRLPVTFYKTVNDLPSFENYNMEGRTYRYFKGEPLYPFGFGLSYTSFEYFNLKLSPATLSDDASIKVEVDIKNTGLKDGDEVVQLYIRNKALPFHPIKELKSFSRISVKAGETRTVKLVLKHSQLPMISRSDKKSNEPSSYELMIGSSSADIKLKESFSVK